MFEGGLAPPFAPASGRSYPHLAADRRGEADLIVLGTHGQSALGGFWAGSVTPSIVWRARRPLLLVPVDQAGDAGR